MIIKAIFGCFKMTLARNQVNKIYHPWQIQIKLLCQANKPWIRARLQLFLYSHQQKKKCFEGKYAIKSSTVSHLKWVQMIKNGELLYRTTHYHKQWNVDDWSVLHDKAKNLLTKQKHSQNRSIWSAHNWDYAIAPKWNISY